MNPCGISAGRASRNQVIAAAKPAAVSSSTTRRRAAWRAPNIVTITSPVAIPVGNGSALLDDQAAPQQGGHEDAQDPDRRAEHHEGGAREARAHQRQRRNRTDDAGHEAHDRGGRRGGLGDVVLERAVRRARAPEHREDSEPQQRGRDAAAVDDRHLERTCRRSPAASTTPISAPVTSARRVASGRGTAATGGRRRGIDGGCYRGPGRALTLAHGPSRVPHLPR